MQAPLITLVTDWGTSDFFGGMFKGHLLRALPEARIVDIAHDIPAYHAINAVPVVRHGCAAFPEGTIHIIDVNSGNATRYIAAQLDGQFYLCADTGLLFSAFGRRCDKAVLLPLADDAPRTFVADTLMLPAAVRLAHGTPLEQLGGLTQEMDAPAHLPFKEEFQSITVQVDYFDHYGNAYLNITAEEFHRLRKGRPFAAYLKDAVLRTLRSDYLPRVAGGEDLSLIESCTGRLQVAVCQDRAERLLGLSLGTRIEIRFQ